MISARLYHLDFIFIFHIIVFLSHYECFLHKFAYPVIDNEPNVIVSSSRSCFLINTADRIIRVYDGREILTCGRDGEPEPMQKLQDLVNR